MAGSCSHTHAASTQRYRNVLWGVLIINAVMFAVEIIYGISAKSVSLLADSLDFLGDAANYGISLFVLNKALTMRAKASLIKGATIGVFGLWIFGTTIWQFLAGDLPNYHQMGVIGVLAFVANVVSAVMLYAFREGDSNMRGVWLCSRNDALGNIAVVAAGVAVYFTQSNLPDLVVALLMSLLALQAAWAIVRQAKGELNDEKPADNHSSCGHSH
ncbi:MAG: cation diffusion facilitator family transporter [Moraxella sp.]|nr:cation diffusion facilitator family transporter [Moraxella sp.]